MTEPFFPGLELNPTLITLLLFALPALVGYVAGRTGSVTTRELLQDNESRPEAIARLRSVPAQAYTTAITRLTTWAENFYGPKYSFQAYSRCLQIAYLYPVVALLLGWVFFDIGDIGGFAFLEEGRGFFDRLWRLGVLLIGWAIAGWILSNLDNLHAWIVDRLDRDRQGTTPGASFLSKVAPGVVRFLAGTFTFAFAVAVAVAVAFAGAVAGTFAVAGAVAVAGAFAGAVAGTFAVAGAFAGAFAFAGDQEASTVWVLFFVLLPFVNALADWISVSVTRWFLEQLSHKLPAAKRPGLPIILWDLFLDLLVAVVCLVGLVALIVAALTVWDNIAPNSFLFNWRAYWQDIRANPSHGTALYLMCLTTLIPTILHVIAGLGAFLTHKSRLMNQAADMLEDTNGAPSLIQIDDALRLIGRARFWGFGIAAFLSIGLPALLLAMLL